MSLILETLKKLKSEKKEDKVYLPPNLQKQEGKDKYSFLKRNKKVLVLTSLLLAIGILILSLTQYLNLKLLTDSTVIAYNYKNPVNTSNNKKVVENEIKSAEKEEKITTANNQNYYKVKEDRRENTIEKTEKLEKKEKIKPRENKLVHNINENKATELPPPILSKKKYNQNKEKQISKGEIWKHINLANEYVKSGNLEKAIQEYYFVIKYKKDEKIFNNLIYLLVKTNKIDDLYKLISKYNIFKNRKLFTKTVILLLNAGKFRFSMKIIELYRQYIDKYIYLYLKGLYYEGIGNIDKAIEFYSMAYKENPFDDLISYSYARLLDIRGNMDKALNIYKRLYKNTKNIKLKNIVKDRINKLEVWYDE